MRTEARVFHTCIAPQAVTAAAAALYMSQTEQAYSQQTEPAPTDFDLPRNSHTLPWSAV